MEHALSTHVLSNHRLTSVWLDRIWEAGIPSVEIFCAKQHFDYTDRAQVNELGYWFRDSELKLHSLHSPIFSDDYWGQSGPSSVVSITERSKPRQMQALDEIKRALEVAEKIPCRYFIQHLGVAGEEYDDSKLDAAFSALEELSLFAGQRGVEVLLENIPNSLASAERLNHFLEITHLHLNFCLDTGHANLMEGVDAAISLMRSRIRSTHVHDNDGKKDAHLFPTLDPAGTIDWKRTMGQLRGLAGQTPLLLELKDSAAHPNPIEAVRRIFENLESI